MWELLNEALLDLISDPLRWGLEEPAGSGDLRSITVSRFRCVRIGVLYGIEDPDARTVGLIGIWIEPEG